MKTYLLSLLGACLLAAGCATSGKTPGSPHPPALDKIPPSNLLIISATYGSGIKYADVTYRVDDLLRQTDTEFFARPEWLGADPTPGWNKALVIVYEFKNYRHIFTTGEGGTVSASLLMDNAGK